MNDYCKACGLIVEVVEESILGRMKAVYCVGSHHFVKVKPDR